MPRTKISKVSKRNREQAQREDKIRAHEVSLDGFLLDLQNMATGYALEIDSLVDNLLMSTSSKILDMKVSDFLRINLFGPTENALDVNSTHLTNSASTTKSASLCRSSSKTGNPNDEGYLTEDSTNNAPLRTPLLPMTKLSLMKQQNGRTQGPLSSARARNTRRSRSACNNYTVTAPGSTLKSKSRAVTSTASEHIGRAKIRTPVPSRKALSADRSEDVIFNKSITSPSSVLMRWAKPGELVLSTHGSPLVAHLPDRFANVNIPMRNGILLMRPKKLQDFKIDMVDALEPETLKQIRTIKDNLDLIVRMADKADKADKA